MTALIAVLAVLVGFAESDTTVIFKWCYGVFSAIS
jgi:hypothetical protein